MAKILGNVKLKVDGQLVKAVSDTVEFDPGGFVRASEMADDQFNYSEKPAPSMLDFEGLYTAELDIGKLNRLASGNVEIITDLPGVKHSITNATRMGDPIKVTASNGHFRMSIQGDPIPV